VLHSAVLAAPISIRAKRQTETAAAAKFLRSLIPYSYDDTGPPIAHYHADMSQAYKEKTLEDFVKGTTAILCATEAAGMVHYGLLLRDWNIDN
jgi:superfamily II DNA helicase RecQ